MILQLSLITAPIFATATEAATSADRSIPFVPADLGWLLAAIALILALALVLQFVTRRRTASTRAQPLNRRSTDP